jgi:hypothetical protein
MAESHRRIRDQERVLSYVAAKGSDDFDRNSLKSIGWAAEERERNPERAVGHIAQSKVQRKLADEYLAKSRSLRESAERHERLRRECLERRFNPFPGLLRSFE